MEKGSLNDIPFIIAVLFIFGVTVLISVKVLGAWQSAYAWEGVSQEVIQDGMNAMYVFDYMFVFLAVGLSMASLIGAFMIKSHPIFYIFSTVVLSLYIIVSAAMTNAFDKLAAADGIAAIANDFPMMVTFVRNFPIFFLVSGIVIAIVMYGKPQTGGNV